MKSVQFGIFFFLIAGASCTLANSYTNLAGNAIAGFPMTIGLKTVTLTNGTEKTVFKLAIFPESEKRRLAADAGSMQFVPAKISLAVKGVEKSIKRSKQRAEKGLCTKEQSEIFCKRETEHLKAYLANEVADGRLLLSEQDVINRGIGELRDPHEGIKRPARGN